MSQPHDPADSTAGGHHEVPPYPSEAGGYGPGRPGGYGYQVPPYQQPYHPEDDPYAKSRLAAGLLGILLGGLGVHRFYLGYVGIGILQILVTFVTFGFGAVWGLVEGILYLTSRTGTYSVDATGRPLRS